ncbi:MAG: S-methyl-5-thioribose-1-phosphate isomerase [Bacteriovoracaceae bacterium]|nr:S-methyl-5-thioribose-1-phosphate isomerase [Bacteriovoracaceae bacterium]
MKELVPSPIIWKNDELHLLDQRLLPNEEKFVICSTIENAHDGIRDMAVRGAPCIGFTAIYGLALWLKVQKVYSFKELERAASYLKQARPTAVNLMFEVDRILEAVKANFSANSKVQDVYKFVLSDGHQQIENSIVKNTKMAQYALEDLTKKYGVKKLNLMTHCNTGFLACGTLGTALGVISYAHSQSRVEMVYADETRPYMQGSRLTAYELGKENIPYNIVVEGAASYILKHKKIDAIFVGADRIAANGDTANKVGTSTLAIVAKHYGIPFYVVAPLSSFDYSLKSGDEIEIEMRTPDEILGYKNIRIAPQDAKAINPSFDVTSADLIEGIISEKGIVLKPNTEKMKIFLKD